MVPRTTTQFFAVIEWWLDGCSELEGPQVAVVPEFIRVQNVLTNYRRPNMCVNWAAWPNSLSNPRS